MAGKVFNYEKAQKLVDPKREELVPIQNVLELMNLTGSEKVVDLGAGNGYLTLPIAEKTKDRVVAIDLQEEMLKLLEERIEAARLTNVERMQSSIEELKFPDGSFERAVSGFVLHEVPDLPKALKEVNRILSEDGQFLVLDWEKVESEQGPPIHERIHSSEMAKYLSEANFSVEVGHLNKAVYYIKAKK